MLPVDEQFIKLIDNHPRVPIVIVPVVDYLSQKMCGCERAIEYSWWWEGKGRKKKIYRDILTVPSPRSKAWWIAPNRIIGTVT